MRSGGYGAVHATRGSVGDSIRVWRDLSGGAGEEQLDRYAAQSLTFLKEKLL